MHTDSAYTRRLFSKDLTDVWIRVGAIALVVFLCLRIIAPFQGLLLWALILAVALYPIHQRLAKRLNHRQGLAAILLVTAGLLLIGGPTVMLGSSFASHVQDAIKTFESQGIHLDPPPASVAEWPLIGEKLHTTWAAAVDNTAEFLKHIEPQLKQFSKFLLALAANTAVSLLTFLGSLIIAGVMMAYAESGSLAMQRILIRLTGPAKGPRLHRLATATIRSVATGVIGVALIQALLLGIGFVMADVPAAGVWALIVLLLGIAQLPATLVTIPVIVYLWWAGDASTAMNIFFTVYLVAAGLADNVLKPMLLGRGVDAPMPVILLGALGGMVTGGIIGLFIGAVLLAVGYELFMAWVDEIDQVETPGEGEQEREISPVSQ
jgi:predicted PurR-regulated permease PerM